MTPGTVVLLHLIDPGEKYWGLLEKLDAPGVTVRGINLSSFDDWVSAVAHEDEPSLGLATVFFPMRRVECIFADERVGAVESFAERFARRTGKTVADYLG